MRPEPKMSELIAEIAAVMITALRMWGANGMPRESKICTKGLTSPVTSFHGKRLMSTNRVST